MKNIIFLITVLSVINANAQVQESIKKPYIEVTGTAEMNIIPDEIYLSIFLSERIVNKEKITIDVLEEKMKNKLKEIGIDLNYLSLSDANSDFIKVSWKRKDILTSKSYLLMVKDAATLSKVFEAFEELDIADVRISKTSHSELDKFRKEVKINAMIAAREKAKYLLNSIGEDVGKPSLIIEKDISSYDSDANYRLESNTYIRGESIDKISGRNDNNVRFSKIKLQYKVFAQFEIK